MCSWWIQPDWWTAIATMALAGTTAFAVIFGALTARAAVATLKLEVEPALVFTDPGVPPNREVNELGSGVIVRDPNHWYIVECGQGDNGLVFRRSRSGEVNKMQLVPPGAYLEIKNVGRSPAVGITIKLRLSFASTAAAGNVEYTSESVGTLTIDAIPPVSSHYLGIANRTPRPIALHPEAWGTQAVWNDKGRATLGPLRTRPVAIMSQTLIYSPVT